MSVESVKGSNDDTLTSNSEPLDGASTDRSNQPQEKLPADSDSETKIRADAEEHEKGTLG